MQDKFKSGRGISRRRFVQSLAALPILGLPWGSSEAASQAPNFSFVYVTDVHLVTGVPDTSLKLLQESQLFLQESVKAINLLNPDFVIFGGDQVETIGANEKNWQLFVDIVQGLKCPWYFVLGEQDISGKPPIDKLKQYGTDFKGRGLSGTTAYWSTDPMPDVHLIGLDTAQPNTAIGELSEEQLTWLKSDLAANRGKFTLIASHHPLLAPPPYDGGQPWDDYVLPNGSDARELIATSRDVRLVLSGHLYLNKIQLENNVYHVSCAGLDVYPCQYKYFKVSKAGISMQSFEVPFPALVKKAQKAMSTSNIASKYNRQKPDAMIKLCEGEEQDRHAFLALGATKSVRALTKKELKEQQDELEERVKQEEAKNPKGKKGEDKKGDDKKVDGKDAGKDKDTGKDKAGSKEKEDGKKKDKNSGKDKGSAKGNKNEKDAEKSDQANDDLKQVGTEKSDETNTEKKDVIPPDAGADHGSSKPSTDSKDSDDFDSKPDKVESGGKKNSD